MTNRTSDSPEVENEIKVGSSVVLSGSKRIGIIAEPETDMPHHWFVKLEEKTWWIHRDAVELLSTKSPDEPKEAEKNKVRAKKSK